MEQGINQELIRIYDQIRRLQDELADIAKDFYKQSVISYDEIQGAPDSLSSFQNDTNYISKEEVDLKILSIPPIDDSNYLKKSGDESLNCVITTTFVGLKAATPKKDDNSDNVATTKFVHLLIEDSVKDTAKIVSGIYTKRDTVSSVLLKEAIKKALIPYYDSQEVDSKIIDAISQIFIPTKVSELLNDSGFITINDVPPAPVVSVNGQTGAVLIAIPTVPTDISAFNNDAGYITDPGVTMVNNQTGSVYVLENVLANWNSTSGLSAILNKPTLKRVATTGSYNDLEDTPTIPTVPTNVSAFTNDAGYLTQHQDISNYILKSNTVGLVKNDGTIDTNTYLTSAPVESVNGQTGTVSLTLGDTNTIESISVNNTALTPDVNKNVDITVPTVPSNLVTGTSLSYIIWTGTQAEYDAILTKNSSTLYFIKET